MSKMDDLRAMREARYAARGTKPSAAAAPSAAKKAAKPAVKAVAKSSAAAGSEAPVAPTPAESGLCGHRAISGRTCTREQGHTAKSHRYS